MGLTIEPTIASKAVSAFFNGDEYQRELSESLEDIRQSGQDLLNKAHGSNMRRNQQTWQMTEDSEL